MSRYVDSFVVDCFLENCPRSALIAVFDGHGGSDVSTFLTKNMPQVDLKRLRLSEIVITNQRSEEGRYSKSHSTL